MCKATEHVEEALIYNEQRIIPKSTRRNTSILSGFISQCKTPQFLRCFNAIKSCFAYALTAVSFSPILRPNFFRTSRRFIWRDSKTKQRWFRYLKFEINLTQWRLSSGSAPASFFSMVNSSKPALYLHHLDDKISHIYRGFIQKGISINSKSRHPHGFIVANDFYGNLFRISFACF